MHNLNRVNFILWHIFRTRKTSSKTCQICKNKYIQSPSLEQLTRAFLAILIHIQQHSSIILFTKRSIQKQPSRDVFRKRCSENMQQIYRRTPMPKRDFNKVALHIIEIALRYGCSPVNLLLIFRTPFPKNTSGRLLLSIILHYSDIFGTLFIQVYWGICKHMQHYQGIFKHIEALLRHIQACWGIFRIPSKICIFTILPYFKPCHI